MCLILEYISSEMQWHCALCDQVRQTFEKRVSEKLILGELDAKDVGYIESFLGNFNCCDGTDLSQTLENWL